MLGSLSEVRGLIPWMGGPFCPRHVLAASRQPQGLVEGFRGCGRAPTIRSVFLGSKVGAQGDTGPEGRVGHQAAWAPGIEGHEVTGAWGSREGHEVTWGLESGL